jgi:C1A family cysteine protease
MYLSIVSVTALLCLSAVSASPTKHADFHHELGKHLDTADTTNTAAMTTLFNAYVTKHELTFKDDQERLKALQVFAEKAGKIKRHRVEHGIGMHQYTLGLTHLSHLSYEEFKATRLGHVKRGGRAGASAARKRRAAAPASVDFSTLGYTTPPKDQGICGCCWTFAAAGGIEGAYFKKTGKLIPFSKQQLVECVPGFTGCDGGAAAAGIDYIQTMSRGLATEAAYPYTSQNGNFGSCRASSTPQTAMLPNFVDLPSGDDATLMSALAANGPIPTTIAVGEPFMSYVSGIINSVTACEDSVNHAVLLVGYGTDSATGQTYWKVKNSWGATWGEAGYFRLNRGVPNSCGISTEPLVVTM